MHHIVGATLMVAVMGAHALSAQTRPPLNPTPPGTPGEPAWQATLQLGDGRTFVTDGGLAIDVAIARPSALPDRRVPAKILEDRFNVAHTDECRLSDLAVAASGRTYTTPNGVPLNATDIDYLRRRLSPRSVQLRISGSTQPVVVVEDGRVIAVLMPVAQ